MARLGKRQLHLLTILGSPATSMVVGDKISASLVQRGLVQEHNGGCSCITPAGLRALADEMEAGRVASAIERMKRDVERRRSRDDTP